MKLPKFDNDARRWDNYKAFHNDLSGGFTMFESGELIYDRYSPDPDQRHHFMGRSVQIVATTDNDCPRLYLPDGTPVVTAWLNRNGLQYLCIDHQMNCAVALMRHRWSNGSLPEQDKLVPSYLRARFSVYWAGEGSAPIGNPIVVAPPHKMASEERTHLANIRAQCEAWHALVGIDGERGRNRSITLPDGRKMWHNPAPYAPSEVMCKSFTELDNYARIDIAECGYASWYDMMEFPSLRVRLSQPETLTEVQLEDA